MTTVVVVVALVVLVATYVTWTAQRLDRLHARVDAAWAALDAQLVRRAAAARAVAPLLPREVGARLEEVAHAALEAGEEEREPVENTLSGELRRAVPLVPSGGSLDELRAAAARVGLARSFHNAAVSDTRAVRRRRMPRALRLAGHRPLPQFFEIDDTAVPGPADLPSTGARPT